MSKLLEERDTWLVPHGSCIRQSYELYVSFILHRIKLSDCYAVGHLHNTNVEEDVRQLADKTFGTGFAPTMASRFLRACVKKTVYYSRLYTRIKTRNCYTVCYKDGDDYEQFGLLEYFLTLQNMSVAVTPLRRTPDFCFPL